MFRMRPRLHPPTEEEEGDRANNSVSNLNYVTPSENIKLSYMTNAARKPIGPAVSKAVEGRRLGTSPWTPFPSITEASRQLGFPRVAISNCCRGVVLHVGGYDFRTLEQNALPEEEWIDMLDPSTSMSAAPRKVSSMGRVKSFYGIIGYGTLRSDGYRVFHLPSGLRLAHRVVLYSFIGPPPDLLRMDVNHKDRNRNNNCLSNLEFLTRAENIQHSYDSNLSRRYAGAQQVFVRRRGAASETWFRSMAEAARQLSLSVKDISKCFHGDLNHIGDYELRFARVSNEDDIGAMLGEEWVDVTLDF